MTKTMPERHTKDYKIEGSYTWENYWFIPVVQLGSLLYGFNILYNLESGLPVETLETFSYWMELCGVLLIFADLVFRSKTENFLTYMEETGDPRSPNFIGWAKFFGIMLVIAVLTALSSNYMYSLAARPDIKIAVDTSCCHATLVGLESHGSDEVLQAKRQFSVSLTLVGADRRANGI